MIVHPTVTVEHLVIVGQVDLAPTAMVKVLVAVAAVQVQMEEAQPQSMALLVMAALELQTPIVLDQTSLMAVVVVVVCFILREAVLVDLAVVVKAELLLEIPREKPLLALQTQAVAGAAALDVVALLRVMVKQAALASW